MEIASSVLAGTIIKAPNQNEFNQKVLEELKKDPFMIVPASFTGVKNVAEGTFNKAVDKLHITSELFVPREGDIELAVSSLIGCIPTVGPIMQGVFLLMSSKMRGTQRKEIITHETIDNMIDIEFAKIKRELFDIMDKQIEKTEIENERKLCEKAFQALKESGLEMLEESLTFLKLRMLSDNVPDKKDPLLGDIRGYFDILRTNIKKLLTVFYQPKIFDKNPKYAFDVMIIYILVMNDLINHWYALGTPADDEDPATHSFREKLHINIQRFLKTVYECAKNEYLLIKQVEEVPVDILDTDTKPIEEEDVVKDKNVRLMKNVDKIFFSDPFFYPIPSTTVGVEKSKGSVQTIEIDTTTKKGPRIYRLDAQSLYATPNDNFGQPPPQSEDEYQDDPGMGHPPMMEDGTDPDKMNIAPPVVTYNSGTKCYGILLKGEAFIGIKLKEKYFISVRWFFYYDNTYSGIEYSLGKKDESVDNWTSPSTKITNVENCYSLLDDVDFNDPSFLFKNDLKFGFYTSEKSSEKKDEFILKTKTLIPDSINMKSRLYFVEIIVSDE
ncbi:hypothetical protein ACTA71_000117 [Dictyostelium dimigraforme]